MAKFPRSCAIKAIVLGSVFGSIGAMFSGCKQNTNAGADTEAKRSYESSKIRAERQKILDEVDGYLETQWKEVNTLNLSEVDNLSGTFNLFLQKGRSIAQSREKCSQENPRFTQICSAEQFLKNIPAVGQLGFWGLGSAAKDISVLLGQGGKAFLEMMDFVFIKIVFSGYAKVGAVGKYAFLEGVDRSKFAIANTIQDWMCEKKVFSASECAESDLFRGKVVLKNEELEAANKRISELEKKVASQKFSQKCNWYKAASGVQEIYMYDHGTLGDGIGAAGASAGGKTTFLANSGQFPSTKSRTHVKVQNSASAMHDKTGWVNMAQVVVANEKCD